MLSYRSKFFGGGTSGGSGPITVTGPIQATTIRAVAPGTVTITNATNATPIVVTAVAHGLVTGDNISISGITGNTNANGYFKITRLTADTFSLQNYSTGADIAGNGAYGGAPVAVTGIVQANRVLAVAGTAAHPSVGDGTAGYGFYFVSGTPYIALVGAEKFRFTTGAGGVPSLMLNNNTGAQISLGDNLFLTNAAAATLQLGAANAASPVAQTLQSQGARGGTDTDVGAPNLTIQTGSGTGAGAAAIMIFRTANILASGTTQQTYSDRLRLSNAGAQFFATPLPGANDTYQVGTGNALWTTAYLSRSILGSKTKTLTESSATGFVDIAVTAGQRISGEVIYEVYAADATDFQTITGRLRYAAVNKAGTTTVTVSEVGTQTTAVSTGTLTATNTAADTTNKITLSCNAVSSLTQTTLEIRYRLDSVSTNTITPL